MSHSQQKKMRTKTEQLSDKIESHLRKRSSVFENLGISDETVSEAQSLLNHQQKKPVKDEQQQRSKELSKEDSVDIKANFVKMDADIFEYLLPILNSAEQAVYMRLYRWSWGHQRNYCQTAYAQLTKPCNMSRTTIIDAIKGLLDKKWIEVINQSYKTGTTYRVYLPIEKGYDSKTKLVISQESSSLNSSNLKISSPESISLDSGSLKSDSEVCRNLAVSNPAYTYKDNNNQDSNSMSDLSSLKSRHKDRIDHNNIDLSLSDHFYNKVGQQKISKKEREKANAVIKELREQYSDFDIRYAIDWTINNWKEKPNTIGCLHSSIGQAMAAKKETETEKLKEIEREQKKAKQIEEDKKADEEREKINAYKESLSPEQRSELREKALNEIKKLENIREEFISEVLIEAKENEILRNEQ